MGNDVSILPPSLRPHHYNRAALSHSAQTSLSLAELPSSGEGPEHLDTLFLKGHHTLVLD